MDSLPFTASSRHRTDLTKSQKPLLVKGTDFVHADIMPAIAWGRGFNLLSTQVIATNCGDGREHVKLIILHRWKSRSKADIGTCANSRRCVQMRIKGLLDDWPY